MLKENFKKGQERKREAEEKRIGRFAKEVEQNCPELEGKRIDFRREEEEKQKLITRKAEERGGRKYVSG